MQYLSIETKRESGLVPLILGVNKMRIKDSYLTRFTTGYCKKLFITGVPGSGKTTLAKKLSEMLGVDYFSTDWIRNKLMTRGLTDEEYEAEFIKKLHSVASQSGRLIIEGTRVTDIDKQYLKGQSFIVIHKPKIYSVISFVYATRNQEGCKNLAKQFICGLKLHKEWSAKIAEFEGYINNDL